MRAATEKDMAACFVRWEKANLAGATPGDSENVKVYFWAIAPWKPSSDELAFACRSILATETFFPKPATIIKAIEDFRSRAVQAWYDNTWNKPMVEAIDEHGDVRLAPPSRVKDGKLLPAGVITDSHSLPAPKPEKPVSREERASIVKKMRPEAAAVFISALKASGADVSVEAHALRETQDDGEHEGRVRQQLADMKRVCRENAPETASDPKGGFPEGE